MCAAHQPNQPPTSMQHTKKIRNNANRSEQNVCARESSRTHNWIEKLPRRVPGCCLCVCVLVCVAVRYQLDLAFVRRPRAYQNRYAARQECVNVFCCCWRLRFFCGIAGVHSCHATMVACVSGAKCSIHLDWVRCNYVSGHSFLTATRARLCTCVPTDR